MPDRNILRLWARDPEGEEIEQEMVAVRKHLVENEFYITDGRIEEALRKVRDAEPGTRVIIDNTLANVGATLTRQGEARIVLETKINSGQGVIRGK